MLGRRRLRARLEAGERAALAASLNDPAFDPDRIRSAAAEEYAAAAGESTATDTADIERLFGTASVASLVDSLRHDVSPARIHVRLPPTADLRIANVNENADASRNQATVRAEVRAYAWIGRFGYAITRALDLPVGAVSLLSSAGRLRLARSRSLTAFWVFEARGTASDWKLVRVEPAQSGRHHLGRDPSGDDVQLRQLRAEAVLEVAEPPATPAIPLEVAQSISGLAPGAALRELALVDDRFDPQLIEIAVREIVERWTAASDGATEALAAVAEPSAITHLLEPADHAVRGAELEDLRVTRVHALRTPPELLVEVTVRAWYGPRDPGRWEGAVRSRKQWWRLVASPSRRHPWRLFDPAVHPFDAS